MQASENQRKTIARKLFHEKEDREGFDAWAKQSLTVGQASAIIGQIYGWAHSDYGVDDRVTEKFDQAAQDLKNFGCPIKTDIRGFFGVRMKHPVGNVHVIGNPKFGHAEIMGVDNVSEHANGMV